jgi:hypothetical protein
MHLLRIGTPRMSDVPPSARDHPLARAVFVSVYNSRAQHGLRVAAGALLLTKHSLRGLLFSWPVYVLAVAGFYASGWLRVLLWSLAVPGIGLSLYILQRGIREDYKSRVTGQLLTRADLARLLRGGMA